MKLKGKLISSKASLERAGACSAAEDACCNDFNREGRGSFCPFVLFRKLAISFFQRQYSAAWYLRKKYAGCHAEDTDELLSGKGFIQKEHAAESAKDHFQT